MSEMQKPTEEQIRKWMAAGRCPKCGGYMNHYSHGYETEDGEYECEHEWECEDCSYLVN